MPFTLYQELLAAPAPASEPDWERYRNLVLHLSTGQNEVILALILEHCDLNRVDTTTILKTVPGIGTVVNIATTPEPLKEILIKYLNQVKLNLPR